MNINKVEKLIESPILFSNFKFVGGIISAFLFS
jgi:hypothetical protein